MQRDLLCSIEADKNEGLIDNMVGPDYLAT